MRKLQISDSGIMEISLQNEIFRSKESRYNHKLHGLLLICRGFTCYDVAKMFGQNPTTVQRWIKSFENDGFSGLEDGDKTGRPQRLDPIQLKEINSALRKSPHELGYEQNLWDGRLLSYHIKKIHKISLGIRQCQRLFHKLDFRMRKPRPLIAHADKEEQSAFKKTPSVGSKKRH